MNTRSEVIFILFLLVAGMVPSSHAKQAVGGEQRDYYLQIDLSQWEVEVYDLNKIEDLILSGVPSVEAKERSRYTDRIILEKNARVNLQIFSLDVQHGIAITSMDIQESIDRRDYSVYTFPVYIDFETPRKDTTLELICHVYCGLGHGDMKFKFQIGDGDVEYGRPLLFGFVLLNIILFTYFVRKTWKVAA